MKNSTTLEVTPSLARLSLPLFLTRANKNSMGISLAIFAVALYLPSNHLHFFTPKMLPYSYFDQIVPFWPHSVWMYLSEYAFFIAVYVTCKNLINLNKFFYSFIVLQSLSVLIFLVWPTTYPRELFPLPESLDSLTYFVFHALRETDTPANCCPSLHVSSVFLSAFVIYDDHERKKWFPFFLMWGIAIAFSTLTTKQHYWIDLFTGILMAMAIFWIFHRTMNYHSVHER